MPPIHEHIEISRNRTGKEYRELHEWIEGVNATPKEHEERHDILKIPQFLPVVEKRFGKEGSVEYLQHIKEDHIQTRTYRLIKKLKKLR